MKFRVRLLSQKLIWLSCTTMRQRTQRRYRRERLSMVLNRLRRVRCKYETQLHRRMLAVSYKISFYKRFFRFYGRNFVALPSFRVAKLVRSNTLKSRTHTRQTLHYTWSLVCASDGATHIDYRNLVRQLFGRMPCNRALRVRNTYPSRRTRIDRPTGVISYVRNTIISPRARRNYRSSHVHAAACASTCLCGRFFRNSSATLSDTRHSWQSEEASPPAGTHDRQKEKQHTYKLVVLSSWDYRPSES